ALLFDAGSENSTSPVQRLNTRQPMISTASGLVPAGAPATGLLARPKIISGRSRAATRGRPSFIFSREKEVARVPSSAFGPTPIQTFWPSTSMPPPQVTQPRTTAGTVFDLP